MVLLLDTNAALWLLVDSPRLHARARTLIAEREGDIVVSLASVWEVAIKRSIGKLKAPVDLWDRAERSGLKLIDITRNDAEGVADLPLHHRDPFDRLLISQARQRNAAIVTSDSHFERYDVRVVRADR